MSLFPEDDSERKMLPVFKMLTRYFPKAMREVTRVCVANNVRYNPDKTPSDITWARGKSTDQLGCAFRHIAEREVDGKVFEAVPKAVTEATGIERVYVLAEAAWRINAALELEIEAQEAYHAVDVYLPIDPVEPLVATAPVPAVCSEPCDGCGAPEGMPHNWPGCSGIGL